MSDVQRLTTNTEQLLLWGLYSAITFAHHIAGYSLYAVFIVLSKFLPKTPVLLNYAFLLIIINFFIQILLDRQYFFQLFSHQVFILAVDF